jgi:hypothetical protein
MILIIEIIKRIDNKKGLRPDSSILKLDHKKADGYFYYTTFQFFSSGYRARKNSFFPRALEFFEEKRQEKNTVYIDLIIYVKKCDQIPGGIYEN